METTALAASTQQFHAKNMSAKVVHLATRNDVASVTLLCTGRSTFGYYSVPEAVTCKTCLARARSAS